MMFPVRNPILRRLPLLGTLLVAYLLSATTLPKDPNSTFWHVLDIRKQPQGLPQNSVYAILQTSDGYIWVGTKQGLARFDGVHFTTFDGHQQLRESEVQALLEGDDSSLWIATFGGGVSRYKDGQFTTYTTKEGLAGDYSVALCKDPEGAIWIGSLSGASRFKDGRITSYTVKDGLVDEGAMALYCDTDGSVWIAARSGGLSKFQNGKIFPHATGEPPPNSPIRAIYRDRQHALWTGRNDGLFRFQDGKFTHYTTKEGLASNLIHRLYEDPQGNLWIGTHDGLNRYKEGKISSSPAHDTNITAISGDREGNLWVGSAYEGLFRLHPGQFVTYTQDDGLDNNHIFTVTEDHTGTIWVGTEKGLSAFRDDKFTSYSSKAGLPEKNTISLLEDRGGHLWVGVEDFGLYRSHSPVECAHPPCKLAFDNIKPHIYTRVMFQDRSGAIWVGSDDGVIRYSDERATSSTVYTERNGLLSNAVRSFAEDQAGNVWIGTRSGLNEYRDGKFLAYTEKDGLGNNFIEQLYVDPEGVLWMGTYSGLSRFKDGKFINYTVDDGLYCEAVYHMVEDNRQNLWVSCNKGIFRVSKQQLNDFAEGKIHSLSSIAYGPEHGLSSTVAGAGLQPAACKDRDGSVWFGMMKGLSVASPENLSINPLPPPVHVEEVIIDNHLFSPNLMADVSPGRGDLEFHYTGLSFLAPEKVRFKYKLEGYDRDWIDAGDRRAAYYGKIAPGSYTFRVIAANNDGVWNPTGAAFGFRLRPHFYQMLWFQALCAVLLAFSLWLYVRGYQRRLRRRDQELAVVEDALQRKTVAEEQLRHSEARYRDLFESAVYGIYRAADGRYLELNSAMVAMLGYDSREQVLALEPRTDVYAEPAECDRVREAFLAADRIEDLEVTWKRKDGRLINVRLSGRRIRGPQDSSGTAEIIAEDITGRKQLERRLRQAQKMDAIGRLAGGIAHDFNNLITVILGYTRLVLDGTADSEMQKALHQAEKAAIRAAALTRQLLSFSRHQIVQPQVLSLNHVVTGTKLMLERMIGEDIQLSTDFSPDLFLIKGDRSQIEQVVMNLAVNARDAMPHGGKLRFMTRNITVPVAAAGNAQSLNPKIPAGSYVLLEVSDTGCGMTPETLAHIFEPFFTTKAVGQGTGLGLSTIYGIIEQSSGYVEVDSKVGEGTTFRIYLPRASESEVTFENVPRQPRELRGTETVLLIEDHVPLRELTGAMLRTQGYIVLQTSEPAEAERICREHPGRIDLILSDVVMPEISGPDLVKQLHKLRPRARLMYTSGYSDNPALREQVLNQNLPFLRKPYTRAELLSKVREVLDTPVSAMSA